MADWETLKQNLEARGIQCRYFDTGAEAADYLDREIDGNQRGDRRLSDCEGTGTLRQAVRPQSGGVALEGGSLADAAQTEVYLSSANALAETGEIINIDGNCNRVASTLYGHKRVYFVIGMTKVEPNFEKALWRARNVAPQARPVPGKKDAVCGQADRCYDCRSPERVCRGLVVLWGKPHAAERMEVVLVGRAWACNSCNMRRRTLG